MTFALGVLSGSPNRKALSEMLRWVSVSLANQSMSCLQRWQLRGSGTRNALLYLPQGRRSICLLFWCGCYREICCRGEICGQLWSGRPEAWYLVLLYRGPCKLTPSILVVLLQLWERLHSTLTARLWMVSWSWRESSIETWTISLTHWVCFLRLWLSLALVLFLV